MRKVVYRKIVDYNFVVVQYLEVYFYKVQCIKLLRILLGYCYMFQFVILEIDLKIYFVIKLCYFYSVYLKYVFY